MVKKHRSSGIMWVDRDEAIAENWNAMVRLTEPSRQKRIRMKLKEQLAGESASWNTSFTEERVHYVDGYINGFNKARDLALHVHGDDNDVCKVCFRLIFEIGEEEVE